MKRYDMIHGIQQESDNGYWVKYSEHKEDYLRRWELNNNEFRKYNDKQYQDSLSINKYKFAIGSLAFLLILSLVF